MREDPACLRVRNIDSQAYYYIIFYEKEGRSRTKHNRYNNSCNMQLLLKKSIEDERVSSRKERMDTNEDCSRDYL